MSKLDFSVIPPRSLKQRNQKHGPRIVKERTIRRRWFPLTLLSMAPQVIFGTLGVIRAQEKRHLRMPFHTTKDFISQAIQDCGIRVLLKYLCQKVTLRNHQQQQHERGGQRKSKKIKRSCRREAAEAWEAGLHHEKNCDLKSAINSLELALTLNPNNINYLARLSKQWTDMSFYPGTSNEQAKEVNKKALNIAEQVVKLDDKNVLGHIALSVSKGRLAYFSDNKAKIEMAKEAEGRVRHALKLDPNCDIAHHLLGRFYYEMAGLNMFCRALVRIVYGENLSPGSYTHALDSFHQADKLAPHRLIHKVQLGKTYAKLGDKKKAIEHLENAMKLDISDINDHLERLECEKLLLKLKNQMRKVSQWNKNGNPVVRYENDITFDE